MGFFKIIFVLLIIFIFVVGIFYTYYYYEKPLEKESNNINKSEHTLNINFVDKDNKIIQSNFIIYIEDGKILNGTSLNDGFITVQIPTNLSFVVHNYQTRDNCYYSTIKKYDKNNIQNIYRIESVLNECGELLISHSGNLIRYDNITLKIKSVDEIRGLNLCFKWSKNIFSVKTNYKLINVPERLYGKWVKCYDLGLSLNNSEIGIPIEYQKFNDLDLDDYIKILIVDSDRLYFSNNSVISDEYNNDVFIKDFEYVLK